MRRTLILALALQLMGCASLLIKPDDSPAARTGKVGARIVLGVATLGISEFGMSGVKQRQAVAETIQQFQYELGLRRTKGQLVGLLGVPERCEPLGDGNEACLWRRSNRQTSHQSVFVPAGKGTIARTRTVGRTLEVHCVLPDDGGNREPNSCRYEIR